MPINPLTPAQHASYRKLGYRPPITIDLFRYQCKPIPDQFNVVIRTDSFLIITLRGLNHISFFHIKLMFKICV